MPFLINIEFLRSIASSPHKTLLALDIGARKVGIAQGDIALKIAMPLAIITYNTTLQFKTKLEALITEYQAAGLIIGLPKAELAPQFQKFFDALQLDIPYCFEDEAYTTQIANHMLTDLGLKRKKRNQIDDKISAQLILQAFFDRVVR